MCRIEAHQLAVLVRDSLQHLDGLIGPERLLAVSCVVEIFISILDIDSEAEFTELGLLVAATPLLTLTDLNAIREGEDSSEACLAILDPQQSFPIFNLFQIVISLLTLLIWAHLTRQKLRAIEADALEDFGQVAKHALVVDRTVQRDVAEMPRARLHTYRKRREKLVAKGYIILTGLAGVALLVFVRDAHAGVIYCVEVGLERGLIVDLGGADLGDRHLTDGVGGEKAELECVDSFVGDGEGLGALWLLWSSKLWHKKSESILFSL